MTDAVGVLDAMTTAAVGTTTAYTVPAGHAARVKFMFRGVAGSNSTMSVKINGMIIFLTPAITAALICYSTYSLAVTTAGAATVAGSADLTTVAPFQREYFLSAGDVVQYVIGTADFTSMDFQVVGTQVLLPT